MVFSFEVSKPITRKQLSCLSGGKVNGKKYNDVLQLTTPVVGRSICTKGGFIRHVTIKEEKNYPLPRKGVKVWKIYRQCEKTGIPYDVKIIETNVEKQPSVPFFWEFTSSSQDNHDVNKVVYIGHWKFTSVDIQDFVYKDLKRCAILHCRYDYFNKRFAEIIELVHTKTCKEIEALNFDHLITSDNETNEVSQTTRDESQTNSTTDDNQVSPSSSSTKKDLQESGQKPDEVVDSCRTTSDPKRIECFVEEDDKSPNTSNKNRSPLTRGKNSCSFRTSQCQKSSSVMTDNVARLVSHTNVVPNTIRMEQKESDEHDYEDKNINEFDETGGGKPAAIDRKRDNSHLRCRKSNKRVTFSPLATEIDDQEVVEEPDRVWSAFTDDYVSESSDEEEESCTGTEVENLATVKSESDIDIEVNPEFEVIDLSNGDEANTLTNPKTHTRRNRKMNYFRIEIDGQNATSDGQFIGILRRKTSSLTFRGIRDAIGRQLERYIDVFNEKEWFFIAKNLGRLTPYQEDRFEVEPFLQGEGTTDNPYQVVVKTIE